MGVSAKLTVWPCCTCRGNATPWASRHASEWEHLVGCRSVWRCVLLLQRPRLHCWVVVSAREISFHRAAQSALGTHLAGLSCDTITACNQVFKLQKWMDDCLDTLILTNDLAYTRSSCHAHVSCIEEYDSTCCMQNDHVPGASAVHRGSIKNSQSGTERGNTCLYWKSSRTSGNQPNQCLESHWHSKDWLVMERSCSRHVRAFNWA